MVRKTVLLCLTFALYSVVSAASHARGDGDCRHDPRPAITFVEFPSIDLTKQPPGPLTVKGKLSLPVKWHPRARCFLAGNGLTAVLILHGSSGVDSRGDFYARALNAAGIATLDIDMWEARGIAGGAGRPAVPLLTYPDAFGALAFLSSHPRIDPDRIGVIGFSWGAVVTMASATEIYSSRFGGKLRFRAHVAHYPVCYAYNNPRIPGSEFGAKGKNPLTGARLLIQVGDQDDYDRGSGPCFALKAGLSEPEQKLVEVVSYDDAFHAWDRLQVPTTVTDPFANLGAGGAVRLSPSVDHAYDSRKKAVSFFLRNL